MTRARPRRLSGQLALSAAAVLVPMAVMTVVGLVLLSGTARRFERAAQASRDEVAALSTVLRSFGAAEGVAYGLLSAQARPHGPQWDALRGQVDAALAVAVRGQRDRAATDRALWSWQEAQQVVTARGGPVRAQAGFGRAMADAREAVGELFASATGELTDELAGARRARRHTNLLLLLQMPVGIALGWLVLRRLVRRTVRPLRRVTAGAERLRQGELDHRVAGGGVAELAELADAFNEMAASLDASRAALRHQALHDPLTGLANRELLRDRAAHALGAGAREGRRVAVLFVDLDGFKLVNDELGHAVGDRLLAEAARRIDGCVRGADTAARVGGDEFAVLLEALPPDAEGAHAAAIADRLIDTLTAPVQLGEHQASISASIGIAIGGAGTDFDAMLREADAAMYRAKERGGGGYDFFRPELHEAARGRLALVADLRAAIDADQVVVRYQPLVDLRTEEVVAVEALARWEHPERGLVTPDAFIPLAEETGLIVPLGHAVLVQACREVAGWNDALGLERPLTVSVNLSPRQLLDPALIDDVAAALAATGLPAERLVLEVTESAVMHDLATAVERLAALRALGVRVAMDDFGTGHSSLSHLRALPLDWVKVARPFVQQLEVSDADRALVRGIVEFAHGFGLALVAEGVETPDQHARLRGMGGDLGQGFLYDRPLDPAALAERLRGPLLTALR